MLHRSASQHLCFRLESYGPGDEACEDENLMH
jgi:hypothetical protein